MLPNKIKYIILGRGEMYRGEMYYEKSINGFNVIC